MIGRIIRNRRRTATADAAVTPRAGLRRVRRGSEVMTAVLAVLLAFTIGGVLIAATDEQTQGAASYFFSYPWDTFRYAWDAVSHNYGWLLRGAVLDPATLSDGSASAVLGSISETVVYSTPVILTGLSVALAFRAGLFNIGAQGQLVVGALVAGYVGFAWSLPPGLHVLLALVGGLLGGVLWGGLAGYLKARTGAHEVITTIMLNYIAASLLGWLLTVRGFQSPPFTEARSQTVADSAALPGLLGGQLRANVGFLLALAAAVGVWWLLERSVVGFRLRAVGANPAAARTAGMSIASATTTAMVVAGGLAGLAGAMQVLGPARIVTGSIDNGAGFDGITVALLGRGRPGGVVAAGLLFGALRAGGQRMANETGVAIDLVIIVQALTVLFVAAPPLIRALFRVRSWTSGAGLAQATAKGWNG
ncbi:MAG: ABC transporter permease [Angustibacter sp.]